MRSPNWWLLLLTALVSLTGCREAPVEQYRAPLVKIQSATVERFTIDSLLLSITVSEEGGRLKRQSSLANRSSRAHTVSWLPYCGDLIWLLLDPANPLGPPRYNASIGNPCNLTLKLHTLAAGETFAAPEWQVITSASKFLGDSLPVGTYQLGLLVNISDLPALVQIGPVEFVRP